MNTSSCGARAPVGAGPARGAPTRKYKAPPYRYHDINISEADSWPAGLRLGDPVGLQTQRAGGLAAAAAGTVTPSRRTCRRPATVTVTVTVTVPGPLLVPQWHSVTATTGTGISGMPVIYHHDDIASVPTVTLLRLTQYSNVRNSLCRVRPPGSNSCVECCSESNLKVY